jgi:hypothetical protein
MTFMAEQDKVKTKPSWILVSDLTLSDLYSHPPKSTGDIMFSELFFYLRIMVVFS